MANCECSPGNEDLTISVDIAQQSSHDSEKIKQQIRSKSHESSQNKQHVPHSPPPIDDTRIRITRRRAQNRIAQRTYRARKDNQILKMESRLAELSSETIRLFKENQSLRNEIDRLSSGILTMS